MTMVLDDVPRVSRRRKSRKKRHSWRRRRAVRVLGWSVMGIIMAIILLVGPIYLLIKSTGVLGS